MCSIALKKVSPSYAEHGDTFTVIILLLRFHFCVADEINWNLRFCKGCVAKGFGGDRKAPEIGRETSFDS